MDNSTKQVSDKLIKDLKSDADKHGNLHMIMVCDLALGGAEALEGADPGTEADLLLSEGRTQEWARVECARAIAYATGEAS